MCQIKSVPSKAEFVYVECIFFVFSVCSVVLSSATIFNEITSPRGVGGRGGKGSQSFVCLDIIGAPEDRRGYETPRLSSYLRTLAGIRFPSFRRNHRVSLAVEFTRKEKKGIEPGFYSIILFSAPPQKFALVYVRRVL